MPTKMLFLDKSEGLKTKKIHIIKFCWYLRTTLTLIDDYKYN